jgi:hypothetical protein
VPSQPLTAGQIQSLAISKKSIKLNFTKAGGDSINLSGTVAIPGGFVVNGQKVYLDIGGVMAAFALNAKGASPKGNNQFGVSIKATKGVVKAQTAKYAVKLMKGSFAATLASAGLNKGVTSKSVTSSVSITGVTLIFNGAVLQTNMALTYKASNKSGSAQ